MHVHVLVKVCDWMRAILLSPIHVQYLLHYNKIVALLSTKGNFFGSNSCQNYPPFGTKFNIIASTVVTSRIGDNANDSVVYLN